MTSAIRRPTMGKNNTVAVGQQPMSCGKCGQQQRLCAMCDQPIMGEGDPFGIDGDAHPECEAEWFRQCDTFAEQQKVVDARRLLVAALRKAAEIREAIG